MEFVDSAVDNGTQVLIHANFQGDSRSLACLAIYLMQKYHWPVEMALKVIKSKLRVEMRVSFQEQLREWHLRRTGFEGEQENLLLNTMHNQKLPKLKIKKVQFREDSVAQP